MIPQCNPKANYLANKTQIDNAVKKVLQSGHYILGNEVEKFECEFASYIKIAHAVGTASGTDALELALRAIGVKQNDTVITVSHTAVATVAAIRRCNAIPLFADIDPKRYTMDPEFLNDLINMESGSKPKAIIVVHIYGQIADMPSIMGISKKHGIAVIEDCAQAHGAKLGKKPAGTWGDFGCYSFYPTKNLSCLGDGGMVITSNKKYAERLRLLRQYGWETRYVSSVEGVNSRLDEIQAAILRVKLKYLDKDNKRRRDIAEKYTAGLNNCNLKLPFLSKDSNHVFHQYVIQAKKRNHFRNFLFNKGIQTAVHYPLAVHQQPAFNHKSWRLKKLPNTENIVKNIISLPMFPELSQRKTEEIISSILIYTEQLK